MKKILSGWLRMGALAGTAFISLSCSNPTDGTLNIFSVSDDISLGQQVRDEILANPAQYPILDRVQYKPVYDYLYGLRNTILNSGQVFYKDRFEWEIYVVRDDNTLNAFVTPGGYIFVYTGLLKFLTAEDQLAGVMGHEMAHADRRHSTDQLTRRYGLSLLLDVALGRDRSRIVDIAGSIALLGYSRSSESEADEYAVRYLCPTEYEADGVADFFARMMELGGGSSVPPFLSSHPSDEERVQAARAKKQELACAGSRTGETQYNAFKALLP